MYYDIIIIIIHYAESWRLNIRILPTDLLMKICRLYEKEKKITDSIGDRPCVACNNREISLQIDIQTHYRLDFKKKV